MNNAFKEKNMILSRLEFENGKDILESTPQYITIGAHYRCNARCVFCLGGDYPDFTLDIYRDLIEKKMYNVLRRARHVGYCGYGEILLMNDIQEFIAHIDKTLPDTQKVFTTNGLPLNRDICDRFAGGNYSILVSLHASKSALHEKMTGLKAFDRIVDNIEYLRKSARNKGTDIHINLIFLMTSLNIHDLPDFIRFAGSMGAERVTCNYLTIFDRSHVEMSCFFMKEETNRVMNEAGRIAQETGLDLCLPPSFGSRDADDKEERCTDPWEFFYVETQGSVLPCCNAGGHIGYLDKEEFSSIWNGKGYTDLRGSFLSGKTHRWCRYCTRRKRSNIDDIRSHITFRPETRKDILEYVDSRPDLPGEFTDV